LITNNDGKKPSEVTSSVDIRELLLGNNLEGLTNRKRTKIGASIQKCKED
jgi:hypothetical protein